MSLQDYEKAYKLGKRDYQQRMSRGEKPTLQVLDDILPAKGIYSEVSLGLVQIPIDQIVGTKTNGRSNAFSGNFMPILDRKTEFAQKWMNLSTYQETTGIDDPILAYEYLNKFYVVEGNKRVSVMKYFGAASIPGTVIRLIPKQSDDTEHVIYYEFLHFYSLSKINYLTFSKVGSYQKMQELVGKGPDDTWSEDERTDFDSLFFRFKSVFDKRSGDFTITTGDALLTFIELHGYQTLIQNSSDDLKALIRATWEEFHLLEDDEVIELMMDPTEKKSFLSLLHLHSSNYKIAFLYEKTPESSAWTYGHELGRMHIEQVFETEISTVVYENVTIDNIEEMLEQAVQDGCNIVFTTTPSFTNASVKAAIEHPEVKFLNCSVNTSHRYIRTYYIRMTEAKFLMGAIAGAMADNNIISYVADYPLYGTIAHINAFALGAKMVNPRAKIHLDWRCIKDNDIMKNIEDAGSSCVSSRDMVFPDEEAKYFGIYYMDEGQLRNLAMPLLHWGIFYEKLIRDIMNGTWAYDESADGKAVNYWWGLSAGVIDVICSRNLPIGTKRLIELLKTTMMNGEFNPFSGVLYSQNGIIQSDPERVLTPDEMVEMDWLAENIIGHIPSKEELLESALPVYMQQGIEQKG